MAERDVTVYESPTQPPGGQPGDLWHTPAGDFYQLGPSGSAGLHIGPQPPAAPELDDLWINSGDWTLQLYGEAPPPPPAPRFVARELPPLRLHVTSLTPDGFLHTRWAGDEPKPENIPASLRFSSTMPGGFESMDCQLHRQAGRDWPDLERLSTLRVLGPGGDIAGEYRLERAPAATGDTLTISPSAVGWQAALDDDKSATVLYRDIDLSKWTGTSVRRKADLLASWIVTDPATEPGAMGAPALKTAVTGAWTRRIVCEAIYDARAARVREIWFAWQRGETIGVADTNWLWLLLGSSDDMQSSYESSGNLRAAGPGSGTFQLATPRRFGVVQLRYDTGPAGNDGVEYPVWFTTLALYGDHQLTKRGVEPNAGFWASDIVQDAITRFTPLTPDVTASSFIIPQLAFLEPTTCAEIIKQASRFDLPYWGVWENRVFRWDPTRTPGRNWRSRTRPAKLQQTGQQIDRVWNSVIVQYQDADGSTRTVGPPGSGADTETTEVRDDDPSNPANRAGIIRRDLLSMGTSTAAGASQVGRMFLQESRLLDRSGQATLTGYVDDDAGVQHPVWRVRAGDTLTIIDAADPSPRRIVKADYTHDSRSVAVDLDAPPEGLAALLERLGVVLTPLGL